MMNVILTNHSYHDVCVCMLCVCVYVCAVCMYVTMQHSLPHLSTARPLFPTSHKPPPPPRTRFERHQSAPLSHAHCLAVRVHNTMQWKRSNTMSKIYSTNQTEQNRAEQNRAEQSRAEATFHSWLTDWLTDLYFSIWQTIAHICRSPCLVGSLPPQPSACEFWSYCSRSLGKYSSRSSKRRQAWRQGYSGHRIGWLSVTLASTEMTTVMITAPLLPQLPCRLLI